MALYIYAITLFVSAFLLFLVQPLIGKMILPKLGGTPQVWNTCMMFFQMMLLAGYFYTHASSTRLTLKRQIMVHAGLLMLPLLLIFGFVFLGPARYPFDIKFWTPPPGTNPIPATLWLLVQTVGIPFFVVSTSAPLLQKWFASTGDKSANDPYFLSIASNLGSLSALLLYPFLVEPIFHLNQQSWISALGFVFLAGMLLFAASLVWKPKEAPQSAASLPPPPPPPTGPADTSIQAASTKMALKSGKPPVLGGRDISNLQPAVVGGGDNLTIWRRLRWILLAAVPSSLMLGVTTYVSTDLSPFPLLWVIPLALYLLSFILVFMKWPIDWTGEVQSPLALPIGIVSGVAIGAGLGLLNGGIVSVLVGTFAGALTGLVFGLLCNSGVSPHRMLIFLGLIATIFLCIFRITHSFSNLEMVTQVCFGSFFIITMVCHGELAKDRPSARYLTDFFLMMSIGGLVGGVFNGLLAPILFNEVWEFPIAIVAACFLHPQLNPIGFTESLILDSNPPLRKSLTESGNNLAKSFKFPEPNTPYLLSWVFDLLFMILIVLLAYALKSYISTSFLEKLAVTVWGDTEADVGRGIFLERVRKMHLVAVVIPPLVAALIVSGRTFRYALAIMGVLIFNLSGDARSDRGERILSADRSYFGILKVYEDDNNSWFNGQNPFQETQELLSAGKVTREELREPLKATKLLHGTTHHGLNLKNPNLSRLATTYYHRYGPVGVMMEQYNWFPGKQNTFHADARLPASLVGNLAPLGAINLPLEALCALNTEPPIAVIGLGTGTMASYGRPFGHVTYYEIDDKIKDMSLPPDGKKEPFFNYLQEAKKRGANVEVVMGDARLSLEPSREQDRSKTRKEKKLDEMEPLRDNYYKIIVVDAFSSDAIPIHLITKEAIELYLSKLADDGVLCVHTSNRHLTLINPVADIAHSLGADWLVGEDGGSSNSMGHFASEYIMVVKPKPKGYQYAPYPADGKTDRTFGDRTWGGWIFPVLRNNKMKSGILTDYPEGKLNWYRKGHPDNRVWTDDYSNIIQILSRQRTADYYKEEPNEGVYKNPYPESKKK